MRADYVLMNWELLFDLAASKPMSHGMQKRGDFRLFIPEGGLAADLTTLQLINSFVTKDRILVMN